MAEETPGAIHDAAAAVVEAVEGLEEHLLRLYEVQDRQTTALEGIEVQLRRIADALRTR